MELLGSLLSGLAEFDDSVLVTVATASGIAALITVSSIIAWKRSQAGGGSGGGGTSSTRHHGYGEGDQYDPERHRYVDGHWEERMPNGNYVHCPPPKGVAVATNPDGTTRVYATDK